MSNENQKRIDQLIEKLPFLSRGQLLWVSKVVETFDLPHSFKIVNSDFIDEDILNNFGDALRIHHSFSADPFSKDKFEYVLETVMKMSGHEAALSSKGYRGHDITINGETVSLKTQADKSIREDRIWISKFMELGGGIWGDNPTDLEALRKSYLQHLNGYDRIFTLRTLARGPDWFYELVEIPKVLLLSAKHGELVMMLNSRQNPKPGYCFVPNKANQKFQLYFDGGGERKLQIKNLLKKHCKVHATWSFVIPNE